MRPSGTVSERRSRLCSGEAATFLASTLDGTEMRRRMARLAAGRLRLVYVAPERLTFPGFRGLLRDLDCPLVAVDEAHCISEWGHDFRPEYLEIGGVLAELASSRVLACTATATPVVRDEILARLGLPPDTPQLVRGFARPNLSLRAAEIAGGREREAERGRLASAGWSARVYHAGLSPAEREEAQRAFIEGSAEVIVATN